jgi:hypothetical protein
MESTRTVVQYHVNSGEVALLESASNRDLGS